jgi:hypothetical protein
MKNYLIFLILIVLAFPVSAKKYKVFYLGGQSNMEGYGTVKELPAELNQPVNGVYIFHGNTAKDGVEVDGKGIWKILEPGHGVGFTSNFSEYKLSDRFGIELTFAQELKKLLPGENIALIKYSRDGSSIHINAAGQFGCWDPDYSDKNGVNQYDHFLATLLNAFTVDDIDGDGEQDELIPAGILWMQGESDGNDKVVAEAYEANLKRLMDLFRAALLTDDLPVVIGRISDSGNDPDGKVWDYGTIVRQAQEQFVKKDAKAALVTTTDNYKYSDKWHYNSEGYIDFGRQFARLMAGLLKE